MVPSWWYTQASPVCEGVEVRADSVDERGSRVVRDAKTDKVADVDGRE